jgi:hypothetical protein
MFAQYLDGMQCDQLHAIDTALVTLITVSNDLKMIQFSCNHR